MSVPINPETKVSELLDAYPEAEAVLVGLAPKFKALSNPVLRRTVARVTSLEQAARVGNVEVSEMVLALRLALGVQGDQIREADEAEPGELPPWVVTARPDAAIDAGLLLEAGETPVGEASRTLVEMATGQVLRIDAPFNPAPLIDALRAKGHEVCVRPGGGESWQVWIRRG